MWPPPPLLSPLVFFFFFYVCFCRKRELLWAHNAKVWQEGSICSSWGWCGRGAGGQKGNGSTNLPLWPRPSVTPTGQKPAFVLLLDFCVGVFCSYCCALVSFPRDEGSKLQLLDFVEMSGLVFNILHLLLKIASEWSCCYITRASDILNHRCLHTSPIHLWALFFMLGPGIAKGTLWHYGKTCIVLRTSFFGFFFLHVSSRGHRSALTSSRRNNPFF